MQFAADGLASSVAICQQVERHCHDGLIVAADHLQGRNRRTNSIEIRRVYQLMWLSQVVRERSYRELRRRACTASKCRDLVWPAGFGGWVYAARWYSLITPPSTFRRCTGASSGTTTRSS